MTSTQPPDGIDIYADQYHRVIASGIALIVLPTFFVILRFLSRFTAKAGLWWDDLLILLALAMSYGPSIAMVVSARHNGFGKHLWALPHPERNTSQFRKILYVYIIFYYLAVVSVKFCVLTFYRRIFPVSEIRVWLYFAYGVVTCYAIATLCTTIFQCQPIHGFWDKDIPSHCVSGDNILVVPGAFNAVLDGFVVLMPIPLLWRLRTTMKQRAILTGIFACGGFVCVISIVRLIVLSRLHAYDVTWNYVNSAIWSAAEPSMSVIAACLPSLRPLIALIWKGTYRGPMIWSGKSAQGTNSSGSSRTIWPVRPKEDAQPSGGFTRLEDTAIGIADRERWGHETEVHGGQPKDVGNAEAIDLEEINSGIEGIRVENEITVTSHPWEYKDRIY